MSKSKKEIIDNEEGTMDDFLKSALQTNRGRVSIATGYFNVEGYEVLKDDLRAAAQRDDFQLRLLIGNEAVVRKDAPPPLEAETEGSLPQELDDLPINDSRAALVGDLIDFLSQEKVQLRRIRSGSPMPNATSSRTRQWWAPAISPIPGCRRT